MGRGIVLLALLSLAAPARAERLAVLPSGSRVEIRVYGFGMIPMDGTFSRFHGWMNTDPAHPKACQLLLEIEAASLDMSRETVRDGILGPAFMDVAQFPELAFHGACEGDGITGSLLLHGESHAFSLDRETTGAADIFSGRLRRADWGITAHRFTAGSTIRIRVEIPHSAGPRT